MTTEMVVAYCRWLYCLVRFAVLAPPLYMGRVFLQLRLARDWCWQAWLAFKLKRLRRKLIKLGVDVEAIEAEVLDA
jgi:hypothetical protein